MKDAEIVIELYEKRYIGKKPYHYSIRDNQEIENQVQILLQAGIIESSTSIYATPATLVFKKNCGQRTHPCIGYRQLNKIIVPEVDPFPYIEDIITKCKNCRY